MRREHRGTESIQQPKEFISKECGVVGAYPNFSLVHYDCNRCRRKMREFLLGYEAERKAARK